MRQAGTLADAADAQRFTAYLITQGVQAQTEQDGAAWVVWIRDEDQLSTAKEQLAAFLADPSATRYRDAPALATRRQEEEAGRRMQAQRNIRELGTEWSAGAGPVRIGPLTRTLLALCVLVFVISDFGNASTSTVVRSLSFVDLKSPAVVRELVQESDDQRAIARVALFDVRRGELWRLVTPIFLHFGLLHIVFNLMMFHSLAGLIESRRGTQRFGLLILGIAVLSNVAQALIPLDWGGTPNFGGMSGVVYGLLGYAWIKTRYEPHLGIRIRGDVVVMLLFCMAIGWFSNRIGPFNVMMANWAHLVGFLSGALFAYLPTLTGRR